MGLLATAALAVLTAVLLGLIKDEVKDWLPSLISMILRCAVKRLPEEIRDRYHEEWTAHTLSYPGRLSQIVQSLRCLTAGLAMREKRTTQYEYVFTLAYFLGLVGAVSSLTVTGLNIYKSLYVDVEPNFDVDALVIAFIVGLTLFVYCTKHFTRAVRKLLRDDRPS